MVERTGTEAVLRWDVPSLLEAKGFLVYVVTFDPPRTVGKRKRQTVGVLCPPTSNPCRVGVQEGGVTVSGLDPDVDYRVSVVAENEEQEKGQTATETGACVRVYVCMHATGLNIAV